MRRVALVAGAVDHGTKAFWYTLALVDFVGVAIYGALLLRARSRPTKRLRYLRHAFWGLGAWGFLALAHAALVK